MHIGYARTSTVDQEAGLAAQVRDLEHKGCEEIFSEQISSMDAKRPELERAIAYCRKNDILVVTKLDRLARSVAGVVELAKRLRERGASILILDPHLTNATPSEELTFNILASIAQFERQIMLERQREGIAKAKGEGKFTGRQKTAQARKDEVLALYRQGMKAADISARLSEARDKRGRQRRISTRSVYRIIGQPSA